MPQTSAQTPFPWRPGSATGVGSLPGTDPAEAMRLIFGELPDLPHLAELPGRGPGGDLIGRTASLLVDMPVETVPGGWAFTGREGRDLLRARSMLSADLDALEEAAAGYRGPLKIAVAGPWTLAATIGLGPARDVALADPGAVADLSASLAEGVRAHAGEVRKRVPGADLLVQFDEPALPGVLVGAVSSASGLRRLPEVPAAQAQAALAELISAVGTFTVVHCCAAAVPFAVIVGAGARAVSVDLSLLPSAGLDDLAATVEAGLGILAGAVPTVAGDQQRTVNPARDRPPRPAGSPGAGERGAADVARSVIEVWRAMGWPSSRAAGMAAGPAGMPAQVVLTPACGLGTATAARAREVLARCREAAHALPELIEEGRW